MVRRAWLTLQQHALSPCFGLCGLGARGEIISVDSQKKRRTEPVLLIGGHFLSHAQTRLFSLKSIDSGTLMIHMQMVLMYGFNFRQANKESEYSHF